VRSDEAAHLPFRRAAQLAAFAKIVDEVGIADGAPPERGRWHLRASAECFDLGEDVGRTDLLRRFHMPVGSRNYPTAQVGNFGLACSGSLWDFSDMADADDLRGRRLYDRLMELKPDDVLEGEWAKDAGVNRGFFTDLKKATGGAPRSDTLRKLLKHIGRTEADLYGSAAVVPVADQPVVRSVDAGEMVSIARLDLSLPMGPGAIVDDFVEEEPLAFDLAYVQSFSRTPPHRLRLAGGAGDSMFPTLVANDLVWIDTTQNQLLHADRIYAASINGGAAIKRLRPVAGGARIRVISDNKTVEPYEVDAGDVVIWGRVIRFARDL